MARKDKPQVPRPAINLAPAMKPYVEALILSNDGEELCDASDDLKELVKAVREHGGKGHVTVKITVGGIGKKVSTAVAVTKKIPQAKRPATALFADDNGNLGMADPDQYEMEELLGEASPAAVAAKA